MKKVTYILLQLFFLYSYSQVGIGNTSPNPNAVLDLSNIQNKAFLINQVELSQTSSPNPLTSHTQGMLVYNTINVNDVTKAMYINNGLQWMKIDHSPVNTKVGDIKQSLLDIDHSGWYILNGRNVSTLPTNARNNANSLGFTTTLPNAANRFLIGKTTAQAFGALGGTESFTIARANLPAITYTGTTSTNGNHNHTYTDRGSTMYHGQTGTGIQSLTNLAGDTRTTGTAGNHSHTISLPSGGSGSAVNLKPAYWNTQTFIYLGN